MVGERCARDDNVETGVAEKFESFVAGACVGTDVGRMGKSFEWESLAVELISNELLELVKVRRVDDGYVVGREKEVARVGDGFCVVEVETRAAEEAVEILKGGQRGRVFAVEGLGLRGYGRS